MKEAVVKASNTALQLPCGAPSAWNAMHFSGSSLSACTPIFQSACMRLCLPHCLGTVTVEWSTSGHTLSCLPLRSCDHADAVGQDILKKRMHS